MKATNKAPEIVEVLNSILDKIPAALNTREEAVNLGLCATCGHDALSTSFRDELSWKEFTISGLCQKCQDEVFGV